MSDSFDSLEAELATFVPCPVSAELKSRVGKHLANVPSSHRKVWLISFGSGLAAAGILAAFLLWKGNQPVDPVPITHSTPPTKAGEGFQGTLLTYHRALAESPEELDTKVATFAWPLEGKRAMKASSAFPAELLD